MAGASGADAQGIADRRLIVDGVVVRNYFVRQHRASLMTASNPAEGSELSRRCSGAFPLYGLRFLTGAGIHQVFPEQLAGRHRHLRSQAAADGVDPAVEQLQQCAGGCAASRVRFMAVTRD